MLASPASGSQDLPPSVAFTKVAEQPGSGAWTIEKLGVPLFIGVVSSFGAFLVTWGTMSNQIQNMDELLRELRPGLAALANEVHDMELTGSRGLQDFRTAVNVRIDGIDRILEERNKRLSDTESKILLLTERQGQINERLAEAADMTKINRDLARAEHERMTKLMQELTDDVMREVINRTSGAPGGSMQNAPPPLPRRTN
jgi:hypothetical protein